MTAMPALMATTYQEQHASLVIVDARFVQLLDMNHAKHAHQVISWMEMFV